MPVRSLVEIPVYVINSLSMSTTPKYVTVSPAVCPASVVPKAPRVRSVKVLPVKVPYLITSELIIMVPDAANPVELAIVIEASASVMVLLNVLLPESNPVEEVNAIFDVEVGLEIAPFKVVAVAPDTIPPHKPAPQPVPPAVELGPVLI